MSLVLSDSKGKSSLVNIIDTPGHANFVDEVGSIARLVDGVVIVVDVVEGVMHGTEAVIRHAMQEKLKMVLVVNKMDRLIVELRLPPSEAFFKIKHTIEEVNSVIA
jgi:U5 small nuclear ribonucleoprotein component